jgi:cephalosporin hydroxylase
MLQHLNSAARVVTIDIEDKCDQSRTFPVFKERVEFLLGSSTSEEIVSQVQRLAAGKKTLVILDSLHEKDHVLAELKLYAPLVSPGSYLLVQDTNINGNPVLPNFGPGPMEALDEFLETELAAPFTVDVERERLFFTMHPRGYLKKNW